MELIRKKADQLINKYDTNCPFKIAKNLGIELDFENLGSIYGYYSKSFQIKMIHINENLSEGKKIFTCYHELGHAIFHPDAKTPFLKKNTLFSTEKIEVEANFFAVRMLFAKDFFNGQLSLNDAVEEFGIPEKFILQHLIKKF
ncbi:ImmA/IrrE family metallo-endopeptidase [Metabacillus bambusae]|uniref:ImmA/IrrE family metallo-endopeptidase n=1 Tax=Metabacillus bambusae TaxID=2795218 RepID=A0ABS3N4X1_9BACI|nr:ImmA/IrrE family metallo-endopeptidase [Metabacillus bambusae]MBO1513223.1 ImmA/IrrE family metallo-endopeptidase [Metabacillus bambusae]